MFSGDMQRYKETKGQESKPLEPLRSNVHAEKTVIYPIDNGMVPHYTGYIPGKKIFFMF